jgi:hypothetical protein
MRALADAQGWDLTIAEPEINVSGDALLEHRPHLGPAVLAVQTGSYRVLLFADSSRFTWNQEVRAQVLRLVEDAGGEVWVANPAAKISNGTPTDELTGTVITASNRHDRRVNAGKSRDAVIRRVAEGVVPYKVMTPGLGTDDRGRLVATSPATLEVVERALSMRADGATIEEVRAFLRGHGIVRAYNGVQKLLSDRLLIGEIHFGKLQNLSAHEPFVDPVIFARARERVGAARGPRSKSDALLARLGVLRCGTCGSRMVADSQVKDGKTYHLYRCSPKVECSRRVTVGAPLAEAKVWARTQEALADVKGRASAAARAVEAQHAAEVAQKVYDAFTAVFDPTEPADVERRRLLKADLDEKREEAERLAGASSGEVVDPYDPRLSFEARRELIRSTVTATVAPAAPGLRGADRITVEVLGQ